MRSVYEPAIDEITNFYNSAITVATHGNALIVETDNETVVIDMTTIKIVARAHNRGARLYVNFPALENASADVQMEIAEMALKALESQTCAIEITLDKLIEEKDFRIPEEA